MASDVIPEPSGIQFVQLSGGRLEYLDIPATRTATPDLLLLHEGMGSVSMWRDFPAALAAATGSRAVAYSRFGFGRSSPRPAPYTPRFMHEEALEVLPALRAKLGIEAPVLIGHSTGASMALLHAAVPRSDVAGVVAMAPFVFVEASNLAAIRDARHAYETTDWRAKLARHHDDVDGVFRGWNDTWLDPGFASMNIAHDIARIACPILAILGAHDQYSSTAQLDAIAKNATAAAQVELLTLPDCGHVPQRDRPDEVTGAIARFVASLPPRPGKAGFER